MQSRSKCTIYWAAGSTRDIQAIAQKADQEGAKAQKDIAATGGFAGAEALSEAALSSMEALYAQLENMEVYENAVN